MLLNVELLRRQVHDTILHCYTAHLDVLELLQHGLDLLCIHEVVATTQQHSTARRQILWPKVEVGPEEAAGEGGTHVELVAGQVDAALLHVVHNAAMGATEADETVSWHAWGHKGAGPGYAGNNQQRGCRAGR